MRDSHPNKHVHTDSNRPPRTTSARPHVTGQATDNPKRSLCASFLTAVSPPTLTRHVFRVYWVSEKLPDISPRCSHTDSKKQTENHHPGLPLPSHARKSSVNSVRAWSSMKKPWLAFMWDLTLAFTVFLKCTTQCSDAVPRHEGLHLSVSLTPAVPDSSENWLGFTWPRSSVLTAAEIQPDVPRQGGWSPRNGKRMRLHRCGLPRLLALAVCVTLADAAGYTSQSAQSNSSRGKALETTPWEAICQNPSRLPPAQLWNSPASYGTLLERVHGLNRWSHFLS